MVQVGQPFQVASMLTNVPEADYPLWVSTTAYAVGAVVMLEHRNYEALVANTNKNPTGAATDPQLGWIWGRRIDGGCSMTRSGR